MERQTNTQADAQAVRWINPHELKPDPDQPRPQEEITQEEIEMLAATFETHGVINPIEVDEDNTIIRGERRWRAAILKPLDKVPIITVPGLTRAQRLERQLIDDALQKQLSPVARAWAYATAIININENANHTISEIKAGGNIPARVGIGDGHSGGRGGRGNQRGIKELERRVGIPYTTIQRYLRYFQASPKLQRQLEKGEISVEALDLIVAATKDPGEQEALAPAAQTIDRETMRIITRQVKRTSGETHRALVQTVKELSETPDTEQREKQLREFAEALRTAQSEEDVDAVARAYSHEPLREAIREGVITPREAGEIAEIPHEETRRQAVEELALSSRLAEALRKTRLETLRREEPITIELEPEQEEELARRAGEIEEMRRRLDQDEEVQELRRNYQNWILLGHIATYAQNAFCPNCGRPASETLRWTCCSLDMEEAQRIAADKASRTPRRSPDKED